MSVKSLLLLVLLALSYCTPASERTQPAPEAAPAPGLSARSETPEPSIHGYGMTERTCLAWTDGCRSCQREDDVGLAFCSNIGIACQPEAIRCTQRRGGAN